ncbi:MAG: PQQ-dependent sugar dehydrogenase [Chloroflexi bacterium]|nr:PQQ-dependent sugar dehydrogenase [Chloroflexota bacterium]
MTQTNPQAKRAALLGATLAVALLLGALLNPAVSSARPADELKVPDGFAVDTIANVFEWPTAFAFLPDGRMLVSEKGGMLKMIENGIVRAQPVIDLRDHVNDYVDRGFIDERNPIPITKNHYIYLFYTYKPISMPHDSPATVMGHIERYVLDGDVAVPSSKKVILDDFESTRQNHSVDSLRWSPEGYLFVSLGEGAPSIEVTDLAYRALNIDDLHGKLLRINKEDGSGVPTNPFYDPQNPKSARSRVWAYGMRNPFRFAVHPITGIPYVGNVGDVTYEALWRALPGLNFGWPCVEGIINRPDYGSKPQCKGININTVAPAEWNYPHYSKNASLTGGDFNFSNNFPANMYGDLFLADYSVQWIKRAVLDKNGKVVRIVDFASGMGEPVDLKFGPDGALYYLSIYSGGLRRISYTNGNHMPDAKLSATPVAGSAPLTVTFSAAGSSDPDKQALHYTWDFGDGGKAPGLEAAHVYTANGQYIVRLTAIDTANGKRTAEQLITVGDAAPQVSITSPGNGDVYLPGQSVQLAGQAKDMLGNALAGSQAGWRVTLHDGGATRILTETTGLAATFEMPKAANDGAYVEALFSAQSSGGRVGATHIDLYPPSQDGYIRTWWLSHSFPYAKLDDDRLPGRRTIFPNPATRRSM